MKGFVSIIIPIYNMEASIGRCLDSICKQSYQSLQIICIDDGSSDRTWEILETYALKDTRIEIYRQENKGVSNARNSGLQKVEGEYFSFVDPDDYISIDMYAVILALMQQYGADVGCGSLVIEEREKRIEKKNRKKPPMHPIDGKKFLKYMFKREDYRAVGANCHTKVFRTEKFINEEGKIGISFAEDLMYGEGVLFTTTAMMYAKKVIYCDVPIYYYCQREMSSTHNKQKTLEHMGNVIAYERIIKLLEAHRVSMMIQIWVKRFMIYHAILCGRLASELAWHENDSDIVKKMEQYFLEYCITNICHPSRIIELCRLRHLLKRGLEKN